MKDRNRSLTICLIILVVATLACGWVTMPTPDPTPTPTPEPTMSAEEEYYMGWIQGCLTAYMMLEMNMGTEFVNQMPLCQAFVEFYFSQDLFDSRNDPMGWEFPPPEEWRDETMHENAVEVPTRTPTPEPTPSSFESLS